jgi:hypothetical protein
VKTIPGWRRFPAYDREQEGVVAAESARVVA